MTRPGPGSSAPDGWLDAPGARLRGRIVGVLTALVLVGAGGGIAGATTPPSASVPAPTTAFESATTSAAGSEPETETETDATDADADLVSLGPAVAPGARSERVRALLERYFWAVNERDWEAWTSTVAPRIAADQPRADWLDGYRTTRDDAVTVTAIRTTGPDEVVALTSFRSTQDPADAPPDLPVARICWTMQLPVTDLHTGGHLGSARAGMTTRRAC